MIEVLSGYPDNVLALEAHKQVTREDYERVVVPVIEAKVQAQGKIRMLYILGSDFTTYTAGAFWDDAKLGLKHMNSFEKIAVVTDVHWVADAVKMLNYLVPCPVKVYGNGHAPEAKQWICE